jgi:hypothetical protein
MVLAGAVSAEANGIATVGSGASLRIARIASSPTIVLGGAVVPLVRQDFISVSSPACLSCNSVLVQDQVVVRQKVVQQQVRVRQRVVQRVAPVRSRVVVRARGC